MHVECSNVAGRHERRTQRAAAGRSPDGDASRILTRRGAAEDPARRYKMFRSDVAPLPTLSFISPASKSRRPGLRVRSSPPGRRGARGRQLGREPSAPSPSCRLGTVPRARSTGKPLRFLTVLRTTTMGRAGRPSRCVEPAWGRCTSRAVPAGMPLSPQLRRGSRIPPLG